MGTATILTMSLLFLFGLYRADKRQNVVSREVQGLMEYTNDGYLIDEIPEL